MRKIAYIILIICSLLAGCKKNPTYQSYGYKVITSDADRQIIESSIMNTYNSTKDLQVDPNGTKSDNSYSANSKKRSGSDIPTETESVLKFKTKGGANCKIEHYYMNEQHVIILSSNIEDQTRKIYNELVKNLNNAGVKPVKK